MQSKALLLLLIVMGFREGQTKPGVGLWKSGLGKWKYTGESGPAKWGSIPGDEGCNGTQQSPVNLDRESTTVRKTREQGRVYAKGDGISTTAELANNGHAAQLNLDPSDKFLLGLTYQGTNFSMKQLHFHWGQSDYMGSEHTLAGRHFPMEMHLVNEDDDGGHAVLAFLFEVSDGGHNPFMNPIIDGLKGLRGQQQANVTLDDALIQAGHAQSPFNLTGLITESVGSGYFAYRGSLTTPPCTEEVLWLVFDSPIILSRKQMRGYRQLIDDDGDYLLDNFRPTQPLNGRQVTYTPGGSSHDTSHDTLNLLV